MVKILGALRSLAEQDELVALMDREPLFLYPELERRGYSWDIVDAGPFFELTIRRATT